MKDIKNLLFLSFIILLLSSWTTNIPFVKKEIGIASASEKVKDPVCSMEIDKEGAKSEKIEDKTFHFCSETCKVLFKKNPGKFTCLCFVGMEEGDEPCGCTHCSGKGGRCDCADEKHEGHGGHHEGHDHGHDHDHGHGHGH